MIEILAWLVCAVAAASVARHKGYTPWKWAIGGLLFGIFALIVATVVPARNAIARGSTSPLRQGLGVYVAGSISNGLSDPPMTSLD